MKNWLAVLSLVGLLSACGGGGGGGTSGGGSTTTGAGSINGLVTDSNSGARLQDVTVTAGGKTATTNDKGEFTIEGLSSGAVVVGFALDTYAPGYANATAGDSAQPVVVSLKKEGTRKTYVPTGTATISETTEAGPYAVIFTANSLDTTDTNLKVSVTPLDPTKESQALPGIMATSDALLAPLTFADFSIYDSAGNRVNLKSGSTAIVEMPIPAELRSAYSLGETIHCYSYNPVTGQWEDFVDGVIALSSIDGTTPVVKASIRHFSWYGAAPESQDCVDVYGQVISAVDGKPLPGARVEAFPGTVTTTDANGDFIVRTTPDRSMDIFASRTFIDTDGSVSGMPGAKVIEYGKLADVPLIGLVTRPCNSSPVTNPADTGSTTPVKVSIGNVGAVSYNVEAFVIRDNTGSGTDSAFAYIYEMLPNGEPNSEAPTSGATIVLTGPNSTTVTLSELSAGSGFYYAQTPIVAGGRYTLTIDIGANGTIDGTGAVYAVGDVAWKTPADASTTTPVSGLTAEWTDTGSATSGYTATYWTWINKDDGADFAYYLGTDRSFGVKSSLNSANDLMPGNYTAEVWAFSGAYSLTSAGFDTINNITGATVSGQFYSWGGGQTATAEFTLTP